MKKSFLLCLLMTLFTTWAVQAQSTIFFSEDFEGGSMPSGWTTDGPGAWSVGQGDYYTTTGAGEGSYNARITHTVTGYVTKLITPAIDLSAASSADLSFMHIQRAWAGDYDFLVVYYRSKESEDWTLLADYSDAAAATWTQEDGIALPDLSDTYQIAFEFTDNYGYGLGIDMVQIMKPAACPKATGLTFTNVTADNATFSWDAISNVSAWNFAASTEADFPDDADKTFAYNNIPASLVSGNTVDFSLIKTLTGFSLESNTTYYVKLQAICGTDGTGDWSNVASFHTACETLALPFFDGFEDGFYCWTMVDCKEGSYGTGINNAEKYEGSYSFKFSYNTTPPQYLISPEFVAIDKEVIVEFYYKKGGNYDETFEVGYSTTDNEVGSFTWGEEIHGQSTWEQYLETLPAGVKYVAVKYTANDMLSLYIDNFSVYAVPDCPKPTSLAVSNITAHNATFSWNGESDLGWQLCINDGGDDEYYNVFANPFTISADLKPETEYTAKLRTLCEDDATSDWSNTVTFTTDVACPAPTNLEAELTPGDGKVASLLWAAGSAENWILQYSESAAFEPAQEITVNGNSFYDLDNLTPETTYFARVKALCGDEDGDSQWSEPISFTPTNAYTLTVNDGTSTNGQVPIYGYWADHLTNSQFIIPAENLESIVYGKISELVFHASQVSASFGAATFEVYVAEVNETTISSLADWSSMEKVMATASLSIIDNKMVVTFDDPYQYMGGNLKIGFLQTATGSYPTTSWYGKTATGASLGGYDGTASQQNFLPKMTIFYEPGEAPSCPKPLGLSVSNIEAHSAAFSWTGESDYGWQLCINDGGDDEIILATTNPFTVGELKPETEYTVKVLTKCQGGTTSEWSNTVTFTTDVACPAPTDLEVELTPGDGKVARLSWSASGAEDFVLQYSESAAFEPAQEINAEGIFYVNLDDLTPETTYYARVKAVCGGDDGESQWSEPISFKPTNAYSMTINEGTATNTVVPIQGVWVDNLTRSQFIIPASDLASIAYANITQLTFYASEANVNEWFADAEFEVYVAEVGETTISALADWASMEKVLSGAHLAVVDHEMVVTFDDPYQYLGGNLMIGFYQTVSGTYKTATWYGIAVDGASYGGHEGSLNQQNFLPKMTINYIPGEAPSCPKPLGLTIEYNGGTEAIVSWTSDAESWNLEYGDALININQNPYTIQNLALATTYQVRVQALCSEENASDWTNVVEFTTDFCLPEDMCEIRYVLDDQYDDSWNGASIKVYDKETNELLATITDPSGVDTYEGTLAVCDGRELIFVWNNGNYDSECSYTFYDHNDEIIFQGSGALTTVEYTVDCTVPSCPNPRGLTIEYNGETEATISWTGSADSYNVRYRTAEVRPAIFKEDFENGLDQWTVVSNGEDVVDGIKWQVFDPSIFAIGATAHSGTYVAMARSWSENVAYNASNWLISPQIDLQGILRFWVVDDGRYPEIYEVLLSTTGNEIADFTIELKAMAETPSSEQWQEVVIDLSAYAGQQGYIAIHQEGYDADYMFIDDFGVYLANVTPAGEWISLPSTGAEITLSGLNPDTEYEIQVQSVCEDEESDWSDILSFRTAEPVGPICEAQALPFNEDFEENSETLECWTTVAAAEDTEWAWDDQNNHFFRFNYGYEPQYLISPELIPEDMNVRIAFDYLCGDSDWPETFKLGYSYDGNSLDEFDWTDELLAEDDQNWTQFACVVPGGVTYIAIQYTSIDQYELLIDNISVTATDKPTSVEALKNDAKAYKFVKDGALFILHNGKLFNAQGKFVK